MIRNLSKKKEKTNNNKRKKMMKKGEKIDKAIGKNKVN